MNRIASFYTNREPDLIKLGAILAAISRWIVALGASEGLYVPTEWHGWWRIFSFVLAAAMALVEGLGFNLAFKAWSKTRSKTLMTLIMASAATFVVVLTPSIASSTIGKPMASLMSDWFTMFWAAMVALSTILLVGTVGYAQSENGKYAQPSITVTKKLEVKGISTLGLSDPQSRVLAYLADNPEADNNRIASDLGFDKLPTLYGILGQLQRKGLVTKTEDGRREVVIDNE